MYYLDHAATSPLRPEAWEAMAPFRAGSFGNPSGAHEISRRAKNALEDARDLVAGLLGADPLEIVFTGGGTEADNMAVKGRAFAGDGGPGHVITSPTEHDAVLESAHFAARMGARLTVLSVDQAGRVDPAEVAGAVADDTAVISVMLGNNETGARQPIEEMVSAARGVRPDVVIHTDAVQGFVSEELHVDRLGVDLLSLAAHKFGGPKGVGVLYVRTGTALEPVLHGGGQELGRRSGTHNVMGAVGLAAAMRAHADQRAGFIERVTTERAAFEGAVLTGIPDCSRTLGDAPRMIQTSHLRMPGVLNETMLVRLDQAGVAASAASACQSGAATVSHVLEAMGLTPSEARECLRFSFGWNTAPGEGAAAGAVVVEQVGALAGGLRL